ARRLLDFCGTTDGFDALFFRASDINSQAEPLLEKLRGGGPFFLFLNYMDAHDPYLPPAPLSEGSLKTPGVARSVAAYKELKNAVSAGKPHITAPEQNDITARYDGGIAYLDSQIGKLLDHLRAAGLYDDTLIIVTADHGEALGEHNLMGHTVTSVFQDG